MANELPLELVLAIARRAWTLDDEKERANGAPPREFDANAKPEALERLAEFVETFIEEATHRACALADVEGARAVDGEHLERVARYRSARSYSTLRGETTRGDDARVDDVIM